MLHVFARKLKNEISEDIGYAVVDKTCDESKREQNDYWY